MQRSFSRDLSLTVYRLRSAIYSGSTSKRRNLVRSALKDVKQLVIASKAEQMLFFLQSITLSDKGLLQRVSVEGFESQVVDLTQVGAEKTFVE